MRRAGVQNRAGYDGLTVRGGTVQEFDIGVAAESTAPAGMSGGRVYGLTLRDNRLSGVFLGGVDRDNQIDDNTVSGSCGQGIGFFGGQGNRIADNDVSDGGTGIGIGTGAAADANVIAGNSVSDMSSRGIDVVDSGGDRIARNVVAGAGDVGISVAGDSSKAIVEDNQITHTGNAAINIDRCSDCPGVRPGALDDARITGNTLTAQAGATLPDLMARMGHASPRAALIYLHTTSRRDRTVADSLNGLIPPSGGTRVVIGALTTKAPGRDLRPDLGPCDGAGDGNRTRTVSLGS